MTNLAGGRGSREKADQWHDVSVEGARGQLGSACSASRICNASVPFRRSLRRAPGMRGVPWSGLDTKSPSRPPRTGRAARGIGWQAHGALPNIRTSGGRSSRSSLGCWLRLPASAAGWPALACPARASGLQEAVRPWTRRARRSTGTHAAARTRTSRWACTGTPPPLTPPPHRSRPRALPVARADAGASPGRRRSRARRGHARYSPRRSTQRARR